MNFRKLLLVFGLLCFVGSENFQAQSNCIAIAINEYCPSNVPNSGYTDAYGELSDWVELKCNFTNSVSLNGYYLSNDRNNLFKWPFPSDFVMGPGSVRLVWLSGRNTSVTSPGGKEYHTNFTLEQCKNQWLIVSRYNNGVGVVSDSVLVRSTMGGDSWGRVDCFNTGAAAFKLFRGTAKSPGGQNGTVYFEGYAPTPRLIISGSSDTLGTINKGGFYPGAQLAYFELEGLPYDTAYSCYDIFYTEDGSYPVPAYPPVMPTQQYFSYLTPLPIPNTEMVRFVAVHDTSGACSTFTNYLESYCETNTYFVDATHQTFSPDFGVVSVAMDLNWFPSGGTSASSVHVEYYDGMQQVVEGYGQIDRPVNEAWVTQQKGFNISIDDRFGFGCDFRGPIFNVEGLGVATRTVFPTLHLKGGDYESHSPLINDATNTSYGTGIRDVFLQSLAVKNNLHVNALHIKPVIGFINGAYVGVYDLREVFDKYYENYYNGQAMDSLDLNFVQGQEGNVRYWDNTISTTTSNRWKSEVYDVVMNNPMNGSTNSKYNAVMDKLDKESFIDYMILNSFCQNQDLFKYNVAFGRGHDKTKPGYKWHYYLWNTPSIFNFEAYTSPGANIMATTSLSPCYIHNYVVPTQPLAYDGHSNMLTLLMGYAPGKTSWLNVGFKNQYINRYQDLINGPLGCDNLVKHYNYIVDLYTKEMMCHEDPGCEPTGLFHSTPGLWLDSNMAHLQKNIEARCNTIAGEFSTRTCYGLAGPFDITVDVRPVGAGKVRLNSNLIENYLYRGKYYGSTLSVKAIPTSTDYAFHHWEITGPKSDDPLSLDSIGFNFNIQGDVVAVFTDKKNDLSGDGENANIPTGFTPNGDGRNDVFRPLGSSEFASEYQFTIWNRWGQEVFRSVDPLIGWDGNYKGSQALTGVYAYVITYKNAFGESKIAKGNVTLTR